MQRRNTETPHPLADHIFQMLQITDLQGILQHDDRLHCGIECYQIDRHEEVYFQATQTEINRFHFCQALHIPYYIVLSYPSQQRFIIYELIQHTDHYALKKLYQFDEHKFVVWWRRVQPFTQKKLMYEASSRIQYSYIDHILFQNQLAWGVNIDGFHLNSDLKISYLVEKRITRFDVNTYDPQQFFFGTRHKSGDYPAWSKLKSLADRLNVPLVLMTFDQSDQDLIGLTIITHVDAKKGLSYLSPIQHFTSAQIAAAIQDILAQFAKNRIQLLSIAPPLLSPFL